jgi:hypothetical protein
MDKRFQKSIQSLINAYEFLVKGIDTKAKESEDRAYGGLLEPTKECLLRV